jgi:hypothetical protein
MALADEQRAPTEAVINALIGALPPTWTKAVLRLERRTHADGSEGCLHAISSPEGFRDIVEPTTELYDATCALSSVFAKHGRSWKIASIQVGEDSAGNWDYEIGYVY